MGTIGQGILGGFKGRVGTVVGSSWKGIPVMRSRPPRKRTQSSELQLAQQARFRLMTGFLRPLTDLLNQTYKKFAIGMSGFNKAFSDNMKEAVAGTYPDFVIDFTKVSLSKGPLPNAVAISASSTDPGKLSFSWTDNSEIGTALSSDNAFVAAYDEDLCHWAYTQKAVGRNAGSFVLDMSKFSGKTVHTYIGFISASGRVVSDSFYTGTVSIL